MLRTTLRLPVKILPQMDETTCGPTCLHAIYNYWGKSEALENVIARTRKLESGSGTLAVFLACDALRNGFQATIYTYNLMVFDPTWFVAGVDIAERLRQQREVKMDPKLRHATEGYLEFLSLGGRLRLTGPLPPAHSRPLAPRPAHPDWIELNLPISRRAGVWAARRA